jgi:AcrR family transcriptional regulator
MEKQGIVTRTFRRLDPPRQQRIIQALFDEIAQKGPENFNMKAVAERASVAVGSLYQYFEKRESLLGFAINLFSVYITRIFEAALPYWETMDTRTALKTYVLSGIEWTESQPGFASFFARLAYQGDLKLSDEVVKPIATAMRQNIEQILVNGVQKGEISPGIDIQKSARVLNALTIAITDPVLLPYLNAYFQIIGENNTAEEMLDTALDMIFSGIKGNL